jgi:hypothetical protein
MHWIHSVRCVLSAIPIRAGSCFVVKVVGNPFPLLVESNAELIAHFVAMLRLCCCGGRECWIPVEGGRGCYSLDTRTGRGCWGALAWADGDGHGGGGIVGGE